MIGTRDLVLFVVTLLFLVVAIGFTIVLKQTGTDEVDSRAELTLSAGADVDSVEHTADIDRSARIAQLREKLAKGEGVIAYGEPVFESVDTRNATDTRDGTHMSVRSLNQCAVQRPYTNAIATWPTTSSVSIVTSEGARIVVAETEVSDGNSSSTDTTTQTRTLLQLPLRPATGAVDSCIDNAVIGVALDGSLIRNDETWRFRGLAAQSIIGYARDGVPIYAAGVDESRLDACGGYDPGTGYRYHLRNDELFVLGCFAAPPQPFIE